LNKGTGYIFSILLLFTLGAAVGASTAAADENPPNVVFIMADDMGWGDVQTNNSESLIPTPNIDRLAEDTKTRLTKVATGFPSSFAGRQKSLMECAPTCLSARPI